MTFDISDTLAPNSDQLDAVDLLGGPMTFTITGVRRGKDDQPVEVALAEFPRVWRPGKSMRRVLAACWGPNAQEWVGRRVTLYCDETVKFGADVVGGTRISHLSHIDKVRKIPLIVKRGQSATFTVQPLKEAPRPAAITDEQVADLIALMDRKGCPIDKRVATAAWATQSDVTRLEDLTAAECATVVDALAAREDVAGEDA